MGENFVLYSLMIVLIAIGASILFIYYRINKLVKKDIVSNENEDIVEKSKILEKKSKNTSVIEKNYRELIIEDFKDTNIEKIKNVAKSNLQNIFNSIEERDITKLQSVSSLIEIKIKKLLSDQSKLNLREFFKEIEFHETIISNYQRKSGYISIVFRISLEYKHYILKDEEIVNGSKEIFQPDIYEVALAHIIDLAELDRETKKTGVHGVKCPNCFAPVNTLGQKHCKNCEKDLSDTNIMDWIFIDFNRL